MVKIAGLNAQASSMVLFPKKIPLLSFGDNKKLTFQNRLYINKVLTFDKDKNDLQNSIKTLFISY